MSEVAEKTAAVVAENVEDAVDGVVEVMKIARTNPAALVAAGLVGVAIGGGLGWFFTSKHLAKVHEEQMADEIAEAKAFYSSLNKVAEDGTLLTPQDVLASRHGAEAVAAVREYQGRVEEPEGGLPDGEPHDDIVDEEQLKRLESRAFGDTKTAKEGAVKSTREVNVFRDDTFDLEEEIKFRTEDKPYIITHDEFYAGETKYDTQELTYYEKDDTLTDEHDTPLEQTDKLVGDDHLVRFGSGSKDPNIVFVRNDRLGIDYEITRSKGSYLEQVLGMLPENENELKHSDQRDRRRAMRRDDG